LVFIPAVLAQTEVKPSGWQGFPRLDFTVDGRALPPLDSYGGAIKIKAEATGYFRLQEIKGRWFFITPEGHGFIPLGVNHLRSYFGGEGGKLGPGEPDLVKAQASAWTETRRITNKGCSTARASPTRL
jgi:hypothetical protein